MNLCYLNGDWLPLEKASISVMDRGFLFGDGVYEVIPVYAGRPFRLSQHLARLSFSLAAIRLPMDVSTEHWHQLFQQLIVKNNISNGNIYLQITRGQYDFRDHRLPKKVKPTVFARVASVNDIDARPSDQGIHVITYPDIRWQRCDIKAITLLANCLARQAADDAGADEAIFLDGSVVKEGSASNVFMVRQGVIHTAPRDANILGGITRDLVLEIAKMHNMPVSEQVFTLDELIAAEEVWVTSSTREIQPVWQIDDALVGKGSTGPVWQRMIEYYMQFKQRLYRGEID